MKIYKIFNKIIKLFIKEEKNCELNEYCPIYLSYLDKYGVNSKEIKKCKNSNKIYCTKYNLINQTNWNKMTKEEKLKVIRDMNLIEFIDKK
jgi:hypothetical protein